MVVSVGVPNQVPLEAVSAGLPLLLTYPWVLRVPSQLLRFGVAVNQVLVATPRKFASPRLGYWLYDQKTIMSGRNMQNPAKHKRTGTTTHRRIKMHACRRTPTVGALLHDRSLLCQGVLLERDENIQTRFIYPPTLCLWLFLGSNLDPQGIDRSHADPWATEEARLEVSNYSLCSQQAVSTLGTFSHPFTRSPN